MTHAIVTVDRDTGFLVLDYFNFCNRVQYSRIDAVYVYRLQPSDAVRIYSPFV